MLCCAVRWETRRRRPLFGGAANQRRAPFEPTPARAPRRQARPLAAAPDELNSTSSARPSSCSAHQHHGQARTKASLHQALRLSSASPRGSRQKKTSKPHRQIPIESMPWPPARMAFCSDARCSSGALPSIGMYQHPPQRPPPPALFPALLLRFTPPPFSHPSFSGQLGAARCFRSFRRRRRFEVFNFGRGAAPWRLITRHWRLKVLVDESMDSLPAATLLRLPSRGDEAGVNGEASYPGLGTRRGRWEGERGI